MAAKSFFILAALACGAVSLAQQPGGAGEVPTNASELPKSRPGLEQLSRESQELYEELRHQAVRVEMPPPIWLSEVAARDNPLLKWGGQLDEQVRKQLEREMSRALAGRGTGVMSAEVAPASQPGSGDAAGATTRPNATSAPVAGNLPGAGGNAAAATTQSWHLVAVAPGGTTPGQGVLLTFRPAGGENNASTQVTVQARARINTIGIVLDGEGRVLIPLYIEPEAAAGGPITVHGVNGASCAGKFVASDRQMNLTVLQMERMIGKPALLDMKKPDLGSMVMVLTPNQNTAKLAVWTGGTQEWGIVAGMDGRVDGFVRYGQFLTPRLWQPVVRQLLETGVVKRAALGVFVLQVDNGDPERQAVPALGERPAIRVHHVVPGGPAEAGGVRPGDLILKLAGQPVDDVTSFAAAIAERSGETELEILREGKVVKAEVNLVPK